MEAGFAVLRFRCADDDRNFYFLVGRGLAAACLNYGARLSKQEYKPNPQRKRAGTVAARSDHGGDESRPFAEIRKNLHNVLSLITLHRWAFLVPCCLVSSTAFIVSLYYPRLYSASTSFERRNDPVMFDLPMSAGAAASFAYFRTTMHTDLTSVANMVQVAENLGLSRNIERNADGEPTNRGQRERNSIARSLGGRLSVSRTSPSEQLDIISITYTGPDGAIGKRLVEEVKKVYILRSMEWLHQFLERQRDYFLQEGAVALTDLQAAQREETTLRMAHPHANPADPSEVSRKISQLEMEKRELMLRRRDYHVELTAQRQILASLESQSHRPGVIESSPHIPMEAMTPEAIRIRAVLNDVRVEIDRMRTTRSMTDEHPTMHELLSKKQRLEAALEEAIAGAPTIPAGSRTVVPVASVVDPEVSAWLAEQARLRVHTAALETKLTDLEFSIQTNQSALDELSEARNNVFQNQEEFGEVITKVTKARQRYQSIESTLMAIEPAINAVSQDRLMQFSEGQPARGASTPISPKSKTILILAILAGVATGAGSVILAEILDHVYRSSSQVARSLGLPVLEAIDEIITPADRRRLLIRRVVYAPLFLALLMGTVGLTSSMAYLSLERPWTYQHLRKIPQSAARALGVSPDPEPAQTPEN